MSPKPHNTNNNNYDNGNNATPDTSTNSKSTIIVRRMIKKIETCIIIDYSVRQKAKMCSVGSIRVHWQNVNYDIRSNKIAGISV